MSVRKANAPLFTEAEWDFGTLDRTYNAIEKIAIEDLGLDVYPNQIEVISSEQMLDAYSSMGMPLMYHHWSFGKLFAREDTMYRAGYSALAYEIVINSSPCISYLLEENTMTMQALVMAHAAFGHNHFFKNNYLFQQWTNAEGILDYLAFAKRYIAACEERYGREDVEMILDSAHVLMNEGVFRYARPPRPSKERVLEKRRARVQYEEEAYNDLWRTLPAGIEPPAAPPIVDPEETFAAELKLPEENILYFLEKHSPTLRPWQREVLRIVRNLAQYFYPQRQTKVMNEGCATFVHHTIMHMMYERGLIDEGSLLEFMHSHTSVVFQPGLRRPALFGHQSLCARLRHDGGHQTHLRRADRRGSRLVPAFRRQWRLDGRAQGCLGQLSRREFHRAVPVTQADARLPSLRPARRSLGLRLHGDEHS